jgi:hypothetical protein
MNKNPFLEQLLAKYKYKIVLQFAPNSIRISFYKNSTLFPALL